MDACLTTTNAIPDVMDAADATLQPSGSDSEPVELLSLSTDHLETILCRLPPKALARAELTCKTLRTLAESSVTCWRAASGLILQNVTCVGAAWPLHTWKALASGLASSGAAGAYVGAPRGSLPFSDLLTQKHCASVVASSTDCPEEGAEHVLRDSQCNLFSGRRRCGCYDGKRPCYWSSGAIAAADAPIASESLSFSALDGEAALVTTVWIRPYQAWWHLGRPTYAPVAASVTFSGTAADGTAFSISSHRAPIERENREQPIWLEPPVLLPWDRVTMTLELHGAAQSVKAFQECGKHPHGSTVDVALALLGGHRSLRPRRLTQCPHLALRPTAHSCTRFLLCGVCVTHCVSVATGEHYIVLSRVKASGWLLPGLRMRDAPDAHCWRAGY